MALTTVSEKCVQSAIHIAGFNPVTLVDYPGKVASTVFIQGCNLRCRYCHNPELVLPMVLGNQNDAFFNHIDMNSVENIAITGGEPLNSPDIFDFLYSLKSRDFGVKLDTNGSNPSKLKEAIQNRLVDYVAMDIKGMTNDECLFMTRSKFTLDPFLESLNILKSATIGFELRFTLWKNWTLPEIAQFKELIGDGIKIALQKLNTSTKMLDKRFKHEANVNFDEQSILFQQVFSNIVIRG